MGSRVRSEWGEGGLTLRGRKLKWRQCQKRKRSRTGNGDFDTSPVHDFKTLDLERVTELFSWLL
jgi:hypothetical protein